MFSNNVALTASFLPHITHKVMKNKKLKPILKKLYKKDPDNWGKYINQVLASYHETQHLATADTPFFLVYGRDPNSSMILILNV